MTSTTQSRIRLLYHAAEEMLGPLLVFVISYAHHLYFADDFVSSFFATFSLVSLLFVMASIRSGIMLAFGLQLAFLGWVAIAEPGRLTEQMLFSASIALSLFAAYVNIAPEKVARQAVDTQSLINQKEKLWQELFDARQEITTLYQQKQELEASLKQKVDEAVSEKEEKILFLNHHLEAALIEKHQFVQERAACEEDIKKLTNHMHDMAVYQQTLRDQAPLPASQAESMYRQLKAQFEEKSKTLDDARKELFSAHDQIEILNRQLNTTHEPTLEEKHLMQELVALQEKLDAQKIAHEEELIGHEEVIRGLLSQLQQKV